MTIIMLLQTTPARLLLRTLSVESQRGLSMVNTALLKPEIVLSEKNRKSCIEKLKLFDTSRHQEDNKSQTPTAAVLVPLCIHDGQLGLLYTLRSTKLNASRGEVSFPGGKRDKSDTDFEETALRETWEELKIPKEKVDVWAKGNSLSGKLTHVMPILGYIGEVDPIKLEINTDEVEEAFVLSLEYLCNPSVYRFTHFRDTYILPTYLCGKYRIWGLTAMITHIVLSALLPGIYKHKLGYLPSLGSIKK